MSVLVISPGLLTTVQDLGRWGRQSNGVVVGGVLDDLAARTANALVGNEDNAAVLEIAQVGPDLRFESDSVLAWCGADFPVHIGSERIPSGHAARIGTNETVSFGSAQRGFRAWLAISGGIDVPEVLGSRSTYRRAGLGGYQGRALRGGDKLSIGQCSRDGQSILASLEQGGKRVSSWSVSPLGLGELAPSGIVRTMRGPEWDWFTVGAQKEFFAAGWRVTKDVDRMGMRLEGPKLELSKKREMISAAVTNGVVQVAATGQPMVLLASRQSVGGYPRMAAVATADLGLLAQLRPGDPVRFEEITLQTAHELTLLRERHFRLARQGLARLVELRTDLL